MPVSRPDCSLSGLLGEYDRFLVSWSPTHFIPGAIRIQLVLYPYATAALCITDDETSESIRGRLYAEAERIVAKVRQAREVCKVEITILSDKYNDNYRELKADILIEVVI